MLIIIQTRCFHGLPLYCLSLRLIYLLWEMLQLSAHLISLLTFIEEYTPRIFILTVLGILFDECAGLADAVGHRIDLVLVAGLRKYLALSIIVPIKLFTLPLLLLFLILR